MDLPSWLAILIFVLLISGATHALHRVLRWRGLSKEQIQWAIFCCVIAFLVIYTAFKVLDFA